MTRSSPTLVESALSRSRDGAKRDRRSVPSGNNLSVLLLLAGRFAGVGLAVADDDATMLVQHQVEVVAFESPRETSPPIGDVCAMGTTGHPRQPVRIGETTAAIVHTCIMRRTCWGLKGFSVPLRHTASIACLRGDARVTGGSSSGDASAGPKHRRMPIGKWSEP